MRASVRKTISKPNILINGVYIKRGISGIDRGFINESEIIEKLQENNFLILDPSVDSAEKIISSCMASNVVVGVEGSQLTYGFLGLPENSLLMTIQPPVRFMSSFRPRCETVGIRWGFIVGSDDSGNGFTISSEKLFKLINDFKCYRSVVV